MTEFALSEVDTGQSYEVSLDDMVVIRLEENRTTAYVWAVDEVDDKILTLTSDRFFPPKGILFGAPGVHEIRFRAISAGTTPIRLKYWQEWEGDASTRDRYEVRITVRGG